MVEWRVDSGVITDLLHGGRSLILPWGYEAGDGHSFFSLEPGVGQAYKSLARNQQSTSASCHLRMIVRMAEGCWELTADDEMAATNQVRRSCTWQCREATNVLDFVMRFRFRKQLFHYARIAGQRIPHKTSNVYYQHEVRQAELIGSTDHVEIAVTDLMIPDALRLVMYVRDAPDEWVVHIRALPRITDTVVVKLCNRWTGTKTLPPWLGRLALSSARAKRMLWYGGEQGRYSNPLLRVLNPNAYPLATLPMGSCVKLTALATFS